MRNFALAVHLVSAIDLNAFGAVDDDDVDVDVDERNVAYSKSHIRKMIVSSLGGWLPMFIVVLVSIDLHATADSLSDLPSIAFERMSPGLSALRFASIAPGSAMPLLVVEPWLATDGTGDSLSNSRIGNELGFCSSATTVAFKSVHGFTVIDLIAIVDDALMVAVPVEQRHSLPLVRVAFSVIVPTVVFFLATFGRPPIDVDGLTAMADVADDEDADECDDMAFNWSGAIVLFIAIESILPLCTLSACLILSLR